MANEIIYSEATSILSTQPIAVASIGGLFKTSSQEVPEYPRVKNGFKECLENALNKKVTFTSVGGGMAATSGYQELGLTGIVGGNNTPLLNGKYDFKIQIDGAAETEIIITVSGAPITYTALLALINAELSGAVASIIGGDIRITSSSSGVTSTIRIVEDTESDLFSLLGASLETPVAGIAAIAGYQEFGMSGVIGTNFTPLADGDYEFNIAVNGGASSLKSITVSGGPITYNALLALIDAVLTGATSGITGGDIRITSSTPGASSAIALTPRDYNDIFNKLGTTFEAAVPGDVGVSGYQEFGLSISGTDFTPLLDGDYEFRIDVDGGATQYITVTVTGAVITYNALAALIDAELTGASCAVVGNDIRITSDTTGVGSTIALATKINTDIFGSTALNTTVDIAIAGAAATAGYQELGMTGVTGAGNTPLAAGNYEFKIAVDGGATQDIKFSISSAPITYTALLALINAEITGAVASIVSGDIRITSSTTGASSAILITSGESDLLALLGATYNDPVDGRAAVNAYADISIDGMAINPGDYCPLVPGTYKISINIDGGGANDYDITVPIRPGYEKLTWAAIAKIFDAIAGVSSVVAGGKILVISDADTSVALAEGGAVTLTTYYHIVFNTSGGLKVWTFGDETERDNSYDNIITQYGFKVLTT